MTARRLETRRLSQCDRVLAVLADGNPHTIGEIHDRAGSMRLNSRVAELRRRGHTIVCSKKDGEYRYQLLSGPAGVVVEARPVGPVRFESDAEGRGVADPGVTGSAVLPGEHPDGVGPWPSGPPVRPAPGRSVADVVSLLERHGFAEVDALGLVSQETLFDEAAAL